MPVVWHNAIAQYAHVGELFCFKEKFLKMAIVLFGIENLSASVCKVNDVVNGVTDRDAGLAWHE